MNEKKLSPTQVYNVQRAFVNERVLAKKRKKKFNKEAAIANVIDKFHSLWINKNIDSPDVKIDFLTRKL